jgi:hypothetical protein
VAFSLVPVSAANAKRPIEKSRHQNPWSHEEFPLLPNPHTKPLDEFATQAVAVAENILPQ